MALRLYILPLEIVDSKYRGPKYFKWAKNPTGLNVVWSLMDFGFEDTCIVCAEVTPEQHITISSNSDVISVPQNLDSTVTSGALSAVQNALESINIPGNWVTTSHTYREVVRGVAGVFLFMQRVSGIALTPEKLFSGRTLDTTWGDISAAIKIDLRAAADSMNMDYSFVTNSTTVRAILLNFSEQWGDQPINIGGIQI